jgi:Domain of unknown function (DUF4278)
MRLCYRGVQYDHTPTPVEMAESQVVGQYRGQAFRLPYPKHVPVPQPVFNLKYRGVAYCTTPTGGAEDLVSAVNVDRNSVVPLPAVPPVLNWRRAKLAEVARLHQENLQCRLQHRIDVAKAKGDQNLLRQLEQEMQQIV